MLGPPLCLVVADPGSNIAAGAGDGSDDRANHGTDQNCRSRFLDIFFAGQDLIQFLLLGSVHFLKGAFRSHKALGEGEQADEKRNELHAANEISRTKGEAERSRRRIHAYGAQQQAKHRTQQAFNNRMRGYRCDDAQPKHSQSKHLNHAKIQINFGEQGCRKQQRAGGEHAAKGGGHGGDAQGPSRLSQSVCHGVSVQAGCSRVGRARCVDKDRGNGAAVNCTAEGTQQHHNARSLQGKRKRQKDRHRHHSGKARHCAAEDSEKGTHQHKEQCRWSKDSSRCLQKYVHITNPPLRKE